MTAYVHRPRRVAIIGGGLVGLATAWYLQEEGTEVTVFDAATVGAGASWGNAGWVTPGLAMPLPEPAVLWTGVRGLLSADSPVVIPRRLDPALARFLLGFARHSTHRQWRRGLSALAALSKGAHQAFDQLIEGGVPASLVSAEPLLVVYPDAQTRNGLIRELEELRATGMDVTYRTLSVEEVHTTTPQVSSAVTSGLALEGQRYVDPGRLVRTLADQVLARGGTLRETDRVAAVSATATDVALKTERSTESGFDAVVLATGAEVGALAREQGVNRRVRAGRGYSFSVPTDEPFTHPLYLPVQRVACTPYRGRMRLAGVMEFRPPDAPLDRRRVRNIVSSVAPFLRGVNLDDREEEWVGSRPCTTDGLPLIGRTRSDRVFIAGGHGMWGLTLGPVTGELLARLILTGEEPPELVPFNPLR